MRTVSLSVSVTGVLDGSGNGTIEIGPLTPGHTWLPQSTSISMSGNIPTGTGANAPQVSVYAGNGVSPSNLIDSSYNVNANSSSMISGQSLYVGNQIWAVWA